VDKRSTFTGGRGEKINLHWLVGRRDNFGKDQTPVVGGYWINLYWRQRNKGSTSTVWWGGGTTLGKGSISTDRWIQDQPLSEAEDKRINLHW
jgi:hypothetical protein